MGSAGALPQLEEFRRVIRLDAAMEAKKGTQYQCEEDEGSETRV